jgi:hypothetical protein
METRRSKIGILQSPSTRARGIGIYRLFCKFQRKIGNLLMKRHVLAAPVISIFARSAGEI